MNIATFRVAPGETLTPESTELEVECNCARMLAVGSGSRRSSSSAESVTVVFSVVARPSGHDCPCNPEAPFCARDQRN